MGIVKEVDKSFIVSILVGLFFIAIAGFSRIGKDVFVVLSLLSVVYFLLNIKELPRIEFIEKSFFVFLGLGFLWVNFSYYLSPDAERGASFIWRRHFYMVLIIPMYYMFRRYVFSKGLFYFYLIVASFTTFFVAIHDVYFGGSTFDGRAMGGVHPVLFGSISLGLMCFLASAIVVDRSKSAIVSFLLLLGLFVVVYAMILSQTRGAWLALPVIVFMGVWLAFSFVPIRARAVFSLISILFLSFLYFVPDVQKRVDFTVVNVAAYFDSNNVNDSSRDTSSGIRLEMWKAGWRLFLDNPVSGVGVGNYVSAVKENHEKYNVNKSAYQHYHPHNQYISVLAKQGVFGFLFLLPVIILPLIMCIRAYKSEDIEVRMYAFSGIQLAVAYMILSLTDVPFEGKETILFYVLSFAFILAKLHFNSVKVKY